MHRNGNGGSGIVGRLVLAGLLVGLGVLVVQSIPDIIRYIKIERM